MKEVRKEATQSFMRAVQADGTSEKSLRQELSQVQLGEVTQVQWERCKRLDRKSSKGQSR